ncbi:MAG: outer membrane protein transport protein, partial [Methylococcales bacterium]
ADHRTPRIPDNNRYWLSIGASYSPFEHLNIDFAYSHIFMHNSEINNTDSLGHTLKGTFSTDADIVSAQARWVF